MHCYLVYSSTNHMTLRPSVLTVYLNIPQMYR